MPVSAGRLFEWHAHPGAFERLSPPWMPVEVVSRSGGVEDGAELHLRMGRWPVRFGWIARHRDTITGRQFCDVQVRGPFAHWVHTHRMTPRSDRECVLEDRIEYRLPAGRLSDWLLGGKIVADLERLLAFRHRRTAMDIARHEGAINMERKRIAVTGSSGMVGKALASFLTTGGHRVDRMVRTAPDPDTTEVRWDPKGGYIDAAALEGVDAVVHLAGENIADKRWTKSQKQIIRSSRVDGTRLLCETLARMKTKPGVLVAASAIGFYGDRGAESLTELSPPGSGFLADVCQEWEAATKPAADAGIRVVNLRIGVVLSVQGGALAKMLTPFKMCVGGVLGSGRQYMSWIALDDLVGAIHHALICDDVVGPTNAVAPTPITNRGFTKALGRVLHRPTIAPMPAIAVAVVFGEMGKELLLASSRVLPGRLTETGFSYQHPELEDALRFELGRSA